MNAIIWNRKDGSSLRLTVEQDVTQARAFIAIGEKRYRSLQALAAAYPELAEEPHRDICCELCMQLHGGRSYQRIEDPDAFRAAYQALLAHGEASQGQLPTAADFGPFDVAEIGPPRLSGNMLQFYVKDIRFGIPYRVEAPWSADANAVVRFVLLPLTEQADAAGAADASHH